MHKALPAASSVVLADAVGSKAEQQAVDPDCTVEKAARGAVARSTVGVGNRCDAGETARDVTDVDGKKGDADGPLKNRRNQAP